MRVPGLSMTELERKFLERDVLVKAIKEALKELFEHEQPDLQVYKARKILCATLVECHENND